jgi:enamine deaminase RidA (YjgF/YER057c/UK114 family)
MMNPEGILKEKFNLVLPAPSEPDGFYTRVIQTGNLLYVCGHTPKLEGKYVYLGRLGEDFTVEQGQEAARIAMANCLAALKEFLGDLQRIKQFVQVIGYVHCTDSFTQQPLVINGASGLLLDCFGDRGKHTRMALGTNQLPGGAAVEVMCIVEI